MKYRVIVQSAEESVNVPQSLKDGIECEGFTILANVPVDCLMTVQNMSISEVAKALANDKYLLRAAVEAILLHEFKSDDD